MTDFRVNKLANILVHYSLEIKPGDQLELRTNPLALDIAKIVYEESVKAGAHFLNSISIPGCEEIFFKFANDDQLDYVSPIRKQIYESFDAVLVIGAEYNTRELSGIDPERISRARKASTPLTKIFLERASNLDLRWCYAVYPTESNAQEADMSLRKYQEFDLRC